MDFEKRDPDEIIQEFKRQFRGRLPTNFGAWRIIAIVAILLLLKGTFYTIQQDAQGVVLRFGKFVRITQPGLHFKLPLGIEQVFPVRVKHVYTEEFGFRTRSSGVKTVYDTRPHDDESLMLTGDLNVMDIEWVVQFLVKDPFKATFRIRNVIRSVRDMSESVMRRVIGDYTFDEVLNKRTEIGIDRKVHEELQTILDSYEAGIHIDEVKLQAVTVPDRVKPAFNEVNEARQEREKLINQAWEVYNQKIPQAKGEAQKMISEAEGYALERINQAEGDAKRFLLLREQYILAKDVTRKRLYLESMSEVLKMSGKKYIVDPEEKGILPLLRLEDAR